MAYLPIPSKRTLVFSFRAVYFLQSKESKQGSGKQERAVIDRVVMCSLCYNSSNILLNMLFQDSIHLTGGCKQFLDGGKKLRSTIQWVVHKSSVPS